MKRRVIIALLALGLLLTLASCSDGESGGTGAGAGAPQGVTFTVQQADNGKTLSVQVGDEVVVRLPITGADDPGWVVETSPDSAVLGGGDDMISLPSEELPGKAYHEFDFMAVGAGQTSVALSHQPPGGDAESFSFTVDVTGS